MHHEYIVVNYAKIEMGRLLFLKNNQSNLRASLYKGVTDALSNDDSANANSIGKKFILP